MKITRLAALSLAALMAAFSLAGCGSEKTESGSNASKSPVSAGNSKTDQLKAALSFGGETITIVTPPGYGMINTDGKDPALVRRDARIKELEAKYDVKIVQKEGRGTYWDVMTSSIASGSPAGHIMVTQENYFMEWYKAGAFADLNAAMEKTGIDFKDSRYSQTARKYTNIDGKQYAFSDVPLNPTGTIWFFNKRIFKEQNLGDPYEMVKNKTWTWDKVEEIAKKATKKKSDGTVEQWGLGGYMHSDFLSSLAASNGSAIASFDKDGNPQLTLGDSAAMKAFEKMYDWTVKQKIAYVNDGSQTWDTFLREFTKCNMAMMAGTNKLLQYIEESAMPDDFGIVYAPMGPDVQENTNPTRCGHMYFIPKTYESMADKLLLLIDDLYAYPDGQTIDDLVAEKYVSKLRDEESLTIYTDMVKSTDRFVHDAYTMTKIDWTAPSIHELCSTVLKGSKTPGDALEANKVQFQNAMNDMMAGHKVTG